MNYCGNEVSSQKEIVSLLQWFDIDLYIYSCKILHLKDNQTTKASRKHQIIFPLYILLLFHVQPSKNFRGGFCVRIFGSNIRGISYYPLQRIVIQRRDCNYICVNLLIVCCRSGKITKKKWIDYVPSQWPFPHVLPLCCSLNMK